MTKPSLKCFANTLANTLDEQRNKILAHYYTPTTTSPLEGLNNKAKVLKRVVYGYRDTEFFQLRLLEPLFCIPDKLEGECYGPNNTCPEGYTKIADGIGRGLVNGDCVADN